MRLSTRQHQKIVSDATDKTAMLSKKQLEQIAEKLNQWVNVPLIKNEEKEFIFLVKLVKKIDRFIYTQLPNEVYELVKVSVDGVSDTDAALIQERLSTIINNHVNIPYLTEKMEQAVFEFCLGIIIGALRKGKSL